MKATLRKSSLGLCCLAAVLCLVSAHWGHVPATVASWTASTYMADGGAPAPPFPNNSAVMLADGGAPAPPFPNNLSYA